MKAMISQPMNGKSDEEILKIRDKAASVLKGKGYSVLNTFFDDDFEKKDDIEKLGVVQIPVRFLARSIDAMSFCHAVYFCNGWEQARGCKIEHEVAKAYGLEIIYEEG